MRMEQQQQTSSRQVAEHEQDICIVKRSWILDQPFGGKGLSISHDHSLLDVAKLAEGRMEHLRCVEDAGWQAVMSAQAANLASS